MNGWTLFWLWILQLAITAGLIVFTPIMWVWCAIIAAVLVWGGVLIVESEILS